MANRAPLSQYIDRVTMDSWETSAKANQENSSKRQSERCTVLETTTDEAMKFWVAWLRLNQITTGSRYGRIFSKTATILLALWPTRDRQKCHNPNDEVMRVDNCPTKGWMRRSWPNVVTMEVTAAARELLMLFSFDVFQVDDSDKQWVIAHASVA